MELKDIKLLTENEELVASFEELDFYVKEEENSELLIYFKLSKPKMSFKIYELENYHIDFRGEGKIDGVYRLIKCQLNEFIDATIEGKAKYIRFIVNE